MGDALTKSGNCNGGRPQGPHPAIEPYCPRKTQKNDAQVVESRGKLLPKNDAQVVESRGKPLPKTIHMPWKAATKNDAQAVKSCCPNRWYKVVKEQWIATNLIMISPMHNEPATHFSVEVRGWFVFKARRSTFQNARGADRLLSMPQSGAQGV